MQEVIELTKQEKLKEFWKHSINPITGFKTAKDHDRVLRTTVYTIPKLGVNGFKTRFKK